MSQRRVRAAPVFAHFWLAVSFTHLWEGTVIPRVDHVLAELYSLHILDLRCLLVRRVVMLSMVTITMLLLLSLLATLQATRDLSYTGAVQPPECTKPYLLFLAFGVWFRRLFKIEPFLGDPLVQPAVDCSRRDHHRAEKRTKVKVSNCTSVRWARHSWSTQSCRQAAHIRRSVRNIQMSA